MHLPRTIGELKTSEFNTERLGGRSVKDEIRENLVERLKLRQPIFPGIVGYDDSVIPQISNAILSRHNFILLGLRGQAKSRILRELTGLLDELLPVIEGCEINDNPYRPICKACRKLTEERGDSTPVTFISRDSRYVEKLATPDVTIADLIGDLDPIRAARGGHVLSDELTIHYGLLPRANRGVFAINELPDLASKVQVGLFNIMQEGDVQIKGYPIRLPLDVLLVFSANPEDYTARGKIITPLKDRIGSEIITHYPATIDEGVEITLQEAWLRRGGESAAVPEFILRTVEQIAFEARGDQRVDKRSGVSQRLPISVIENVLSNAERRRLSTGESSISPRISDIYAAVPAITGKLELEYEGEQRGAATVARDLVRAAVGATFDTYFEHVDCSEVISWFNEGGTLRVSDTDCAADCMKSFNEVSGLLNLATESGLLLDSDPGTVVAVCELILEGLYAHKRISRSDERGYTAAKKEARKYEYESFSRSRRVN
ncbi:MAG TPA: magnesium chelatase [Blastocatellia bacterium]|jgi:magnesium chelatase subunit I|nr:magnesium chelatase [Blastocatellia bacterium]